MVFETSILETLFQAGAMDRAKALPKIEDEERESMFGYVYGVSGPGMLCSLPFHNEINVMDQPGNH